MIKKTIKFTDYDGNERSGDYYFNFTKAEVVEMEASETGGMKRMLENIIQTNDTKRIIEVFKDMIQKSYGVKSPDGKRFIKNQEVLDDFMQTEAYSELFMELATNEQSAIAFVNGIFPKEYSEAAAANSANIIPMNSTTDK